MLMEIRVNVLRIEIRMLKYINDLLQLSCSPPVEYTIKKSVYWYVLVCTGMYEYKLVQTLYVLGMLLYISGMYLN
jgi:hypothetical protein